VEEFALDLTEEVRTCQQMIQLDLGVGMKTCKRVILIKLNAST